MNIEEYRALKAQEEQEKQNKEKEEVVDNNQPIVEEIVNDGENGEVILDKPNDTKPIEGEKEEITVEINGEKLTLDELKNGYLRQSDYTKKTQDLSRQREETKEALAFYNYLKQNPQIAEQVKQNGGQVPSRIDPALSKVQELEDKMYDMMLEREIESLSNKYEDFDVREVLNIASEKGMTNLEDAYFLFKSKNTSNTTPNNIEDLKEEIRKEILKELQSEKNSTQTIISPNSNPLPNTDNLPKLSDNEARVARNMKLSDEEYIKWRDIGKKK